MPVWEEHHNKKPSVCCAAVEYSSRTKTWLFLVNPKLLNQWKEVIEINAFIHLGKNNNNTVCEFNA